MGSPFLFRTERAFQRRGLGKREGAPRREKSRGEQKPAPAKKVKTEKQEKAQRGEKSGKENRVQSVLPPSLSGKKKRRRNDRPRPIEAPPRSDRQKDSTQHKSLMRPYYINHDDEN